MAEILPVRRKTLYNQSINQSINQSTNHYCYVPVTREVLIVGEDCEVGDVVSWENICVVENVFCVWVDVSTIIFSVRLKIAPSILHKNIMPVRYVTSTDTPFGSPK